MGKITSIFKDALKYPLTDYKKLLILGCLFIIMSLESICLSYGVQTGSFNIILAIITLILVFVVSGYEVSIIRSTTNNSDEIPKISFIENFVNGLKLLVLNIVYYIIPTIITLIVGWITGFFSNTMQIVQYYLSVYVKSGSTIVDGVNTTVNVTNTSAVPAISQTLMNNFISSLAITLIVAIILFIIFGLLMKIGEARLAKNDSLSEGLKMKAVANDMKNIGVLDYIGWFILLIILVVIISAIMGAIIGLLSVISSGLGLIISLLLLSPYLTMFSARALGLIYNEAKE